jgi:UDP-N-acetylglucosamine--N-acetylmuramyl-(pentapeptide) pyrophosphoryl-undecaprenol N-acetylglucosamine transferase
VAEAWANRTPAVFLPYPHHRDLHQAHNARTLVDAGAAKLEPDFIDEKRNLAGAGKAIVDLMASVKQRDSMRSALRRLGTVDGAARIAALLLKNPPA